MTGVKSMARLSVRGLARTLLMVRALDPELRTGRSILMIHTYRCLLNPGYKKMLLHYATKKLAAELATQKEAVKKAP